MTSDGRSLFSDRPRGQSVGSQHQKGLLLLTAPAGGVQGATLPALASGGPWPPGWWQQSSSLGLRPHLAVFPVCPGLLR